MAAALVPPAFGAPSPAQLTATFKDRAYANQAASAAAPTCAVSIVGIKDLRSSPELVGVIARRPILAPTDFTEWMHAVLHGLTMRGVAIVYDDKAIPQKGMPVVAIGLQTAWVASAATVYSANVVVHVAVDGVGARHIDKVYRGRVSRTAYWSGGSDTMQSAIDGAFADALDTIAIDLKEICAA